MGAIEDSEYKILYNDEQIIKELMGEISESRI